jgi:plasmid stabilization system protein ParE
MPKAWTDKRERQYGHIRDSYEESGVSKDEAEERAARTVNSRRDAAGEAKDGDGHPTRDELYERARTLDIDGRSDMDKEQLESAIAGHKGGASSS